MSDSKKLMGTLSPAYGMMTGHGAFGKLADSGVGGLVPMMLSQHRRDKAEDAEEKKKPVGMKKGGKVKASSMKGSSASKRADGCATKGKTRGKMV